MVLLTQHDTTGGISPFFLTRFLVSIDISVISLYGGYKIIVVILKGCVNHRRRSKKNVDVCVYVNFGARCD